MTTKTQKSAKSPVNFYFTGLEQSGLANTDSSDKESINYIIFQNDFLHTRVKELEDEIRELNNKVNELEDDNESLETSKINLKGYVKNQGEFNRLSKNLIEIYDNQINGIAKTKEKIESKIKFIVIIFLVLQFLFLIIRLYNVDFIGIIEMTILSIYAYKSILFITNTYTELIKISNIKHNQTVIKIKQEMKESSKGNDYLNELIDRL